MIEWLEHESTALKGFPMGDPHHRKFPVYLPPKYSADNQTPYDVIFLLAGYGSYSSQYIWKSSAFSKTLPEQLDEAILNKKMPPVIIVFPDGTSKMGCSQYINSPVLGNYMDYICDELTQLIDDKFNTHACAKHRGMMGHSSGGYGALLTGLKRPDAFGNICSSAGDSFFELLFFPLIPQAIHDLSDSGGIVPFVENFLSDPSAESSNKHMTMMLLGMAGCFAPNPKTDVIFGDLFFDLETGKINDDIWQKYLSWDPVRLVDTHLAELKQLNFIQLDCGLQDPYGMQWGQRQIAKKLKENNIPYILNEYAGTHSGQGWRFLQRIEKMCATMQS